MITEAQLYALLILALVLFVGVAFLLVALVWKAAADEIGPGKYNEGFAQAKSLLSEENATLKQKNLQLEEEKKALRRKVRQLENGPVAYLLSDGSSK